MAKSKSGEFYNFDEALDQYIAGDGGLLFFYFSTVDLACHMMWRHHDTEHPAHDEEIAAQDSSSWSGRNASFARLSPCVFPTRCAMPRSRSASTA